MRSQLWKSLKVPGKSPTCRYIKPKFGERFDQRPKYQFFIAVTIRPQIRVAQRDIVILRVV